MSSTSAAPPDADALTVRPLSVTGNRRAANCGFCAAARDLTTTFSANPSATAEITRSTSGSTEA
ncbi:hypothetical protein ABZX65_34265 [Streptomyces sp. NPDC003300]|uniref:hypothetical protein n=1 Tax=unclassified Streptomyces TaxID=2593676 RepID=UPI0033BC92B0